MHTTENFTVQNAQLHTVAVWSAQCTPLRASQFTVQSEQLHTVHSVVSKMCTLWHSAQCKVHSCTLGAVWLAQH